MRFIFGQLAGRLDRQSLGRWVEGTLLHNNNNAALGKRKQKYLLQ